MKKILNVCVAVALAACFAPVLLRAASSTTIVITPSSLVFGTGGNHVVGVMQDSAPGFATGSFRSDGIAKTDMYFTPDFLFGHEVLLGDIASMSFNTKKGTTHLVSPNDWYVNIYTNRYAGQIGTSFYGVRLNMEPYFSGALNDPANTWNQFSTDEGDNWLRIYESTYGYFGGYGDQHLADFVAGQSLAGSRGPGVPYASQSVLFFSPQTSSTGAAGFEGQVDGVRIELKNGEVVNLNFEKYVQPVDRDSCKKNGWASLFRSNGSAFASQGDCVSYVNTGN